MGVRIHREFEHITTPEIVLAKSRSDCHPSNIDTLVRIVNELRNVSGDIVECGSYKCGATIALAVSALKKKIYAFDLFGGLPYGEGTRFDNFGDAVFDEIQSITSRFPNIELIRGLHEETIPKFSSRPLSLIFMDSDHYASHKVCLKYLWPMLSPSGHAIFHDWGFEGVQRAIQETIPQNEIVISRTLLDSPNMGLIVKR